MLDIVLSFMMLAAIALIVGAIALWRKGVRKQAALMVVLAIIAIGNVLIWTVPDAGGENPLDQLEEASQQ